LARVSFDVKQRKGKGEVAHGRIGDMILLSVYKLRQNGRMRTQNTFSAKYLGVLIWKYS